MTQRIFDVENEKDMRDLWNILPDKVCKIEAGCGDVVLVYGNAFRFSIDDIFSINFRDKTEITRPIQEATEADIGKICKFWDKDGCYYGVLTNVGDYNYKYQMNNNSTWWHCRRLTKQEAEKLI